MGIPHSVTKTLAAALANNIAASQTPGAGAIILNGSAASFVSTTTNAAAAAGSVVLSLASVGGVAVGSTISDTSIATIVAGTKVIGVDAANGKVILSQPLGGTGAGLGDTIIISGPAVLDTQRRVLITSGASDVGITFTVNGTNDAGNPISDTFQGGAVTAASNLDFKTVTSVTHTGAVASTVLIGTNTIGSTPWQIIDAQVDPTNVSLLATPGGTTANYKIEYSLDPIATLFGPPVPPGVPNLGVIAMTAGTVSPPVGDSATLTFPVTAIRLTMAVAGVAQTLEWLQAGMAGIAGATS
jgi:hypothetical protein